MRVHRCTSRLTLLDAKSNYPRSGSTIHGWFIPGQKGAGAIVLMHGVRANRLAMVGRARFLSRAGYTVLLFDFQAHGESPGAHITFGYLERRDAVAAVRFMRANAPGEKVGVIGVSMGGAAALLATPPLEVDAMVLEMVYPTIDQAVSNRLTMRLVGWARVLTPLLPGSSVRAQDLVPTTCGRSTRSPNQDAQTIHRWGRGPTHYAWKIPADVCRGE